MKFLFIEKKNKVIRENICDILTIPMRIWKKKEASNLLIFIMFKENIQRRKIWITLIVFLSLYFTFIWYFTVIYLSLFTFLILELLRLCIEDKKSEDLPNLI